MRKKQDIFLTKIQTIEEKPANEITIDEPVKPEVDPNLYPIRKLRYELKETSIISVRNFSSLTIRLQIHGSSDRQHNSQLDKQQHIVAHHENQHILYTYRER